MNAVKGIQKIVGCRLVLILAIVAAGLAPRLEACSCPAPPPPREALENAAAVFLGMATSVEEHGPGENRRVFEFEVIDVWKGLETGHATVQTGRGDGDCGYRFELDEIYLVYAFEEGVGLGTDICTRTCDQANARADLEELGDPLGLETDPTRSLSSVIGLALGATLLVAIFALRRRR